MYAKFSQSLRPCLREGESGADVSGDGILVIDLCDAPSGGESAGALLAIMDAANSSAADNEVSADSEGIPGILLAFSGRTCMAACETA